MATTDNENKEYRPEDEGNSTFSWRTLLTMVILHWQWIVVSVVLCLGAAFLYLRYTTPVYSVSTKLLVKDNNDGYSSRRSGIANIENLGLMTNSNGIENEIEILSSTLLSAEAVKTLQLYTQYYHKGRVRWRYEYNTQDVSATFDDTMRDSLEFPIIFTIKNNKGHYTVRGKYYPPLPDDENIDHIEKIAIDTTFATLPATLATLYGPITLENNGHRSLDDGETERVEIYPLAMMARYYAKALQVEQSNKYTTIAILTLRDISVARGIDYLTALFDAYNAQANDDKNEIALRTEAFINERLAKVGAELGTTDASIETFKKSNKLMELTLSQTETMKNSSDYDQRLIDINMQISLINNLSSYIEKEENKYQVIPSNIGLTDVNTSQLITNYNKLALDRSALLRTASDKNPALRPLTLQLDELHTSIQEAMAQAKKSLEIQKNSIETQYNKYQQQITQSPQQQRVMTEIGRQQEVQTALYTMLLQKREENSISLAATANKGQLIDAAISNGKVHPRKRLVVAAALLVGLLLPFAIFYLLQFFRYKIEGHDDVVQLTTLPILADVPIANDVKKSVGEVVVFENSNSTMEEIFRSLRTNLQFLLTEGQKVILATSSISGEGKTFITSNLAISFALLGKRVILVGMDIRKPRLSELFQLHNHHNGITPLLTLAAPTRDDVLAQIVPSQVNDNLDILMAGPIPPNPAELLGRKQLDTVIAILKEEYDYVLLDTAPVGLVTDTLIISRVADVAMAVVRADYTPKENVQMLTAIADEKKLPTTAIVINGIDMAKKKYGYYYGYGKYAHYGKYNRHYSSYGGNGYGKGYGGYGYGTYGKNTYVDKNDHSVKQ